MQTHQDIWFSVGKEDEHIYFRTFDDNPEISPYLDFIPWPIRVEALFFADGTSMDTAASGGAQTPWISNINADGFDLFGAGNISAGNLDVTTINGQPLSALQTPWLSDIDGNGFDLFGAGNLTISGGVTNISGGDLMIFASPGNVILSTPNTVSVNSGNLDVVCPGNIFITSNVLSIGLGAPNGPINLTSQIGVIINGPIDSMTPALTVNGGTAPPPTVATLASFRSTTTFGYIDINALAEAGIYFNTSSPSVLSANINLNPGLGYLRFIIGSVIGILIAKNGGIYFPNLPTSPSGLNPGGVWNNGGVLNIV